MKAPPSSTSCRTIAVIPARYASTRFPGKPLAPIAGKPMIQWVYEQVAGCRNVAEVIVATDDERIMAAVRGFGGRAVMTSAAHRTGTDRIAEAIRDIPADLVVNAQGDEPLLPTAVIERLVETVRLQAAVMGTVAVPFRFTDRDPTDPNTVKVVLDNQGYALYFSRARIPHRRAGGVAVEPLLHWGLYAYRRDFLEEFVRWPQGLLESCEQLEQLRAVERNIRILVVQAATATVGVDVPEDIERVEKLLRKQAQKAAAP